MVAEEVADMVADIVVGMEVDEMVVNMMDIIKKLPFLSDPGVPWVRSMGLGICHYKTILKT